MEGPPQHPGNPKWQTKTEWIKQKTPHCIDYIKNEAETLEESFDRFNLTQEDGDWGDISEAKDAGWGEPTKGGGW